jgi:hypothetical protein
MSFLFEAAKIQHFGLTEKEKCKKLSYNPIKNAVIAQQSVLF